MKRVWRSREREVTNSSAFEGVPPAIARFLAARGFTSQEELELLVEPKLDGIADAFSLRGMREATERIRNAFENKEKICVYADFDMDGTSGLALLVEGLKALGFSEVIPYQPRRLVEGYGFHANAVEDLHVQKVNLIITVDVGITAFEACAKARELGIDVIITDHHQSAETLPDALTIINPNLPGCNSQLGYLSGAGVAFYLLRALKRTWHNSGLAEYDKLDLKSLLDFFIIGTLTDMVPLIDDNRLLVRHGLRVMEQTRRPGLRALLDDLSLSGRSLGSQEVAIRLAPKLNAASRLELGVRPIDLLLETDPERAKELSSKIIEQNGVRVDLQAEADAEATLLLQDWPHSDFVFVASPKFHRGVIGLVATKLAQTFKAPAFVGAYTEDGSIVGSARAPDSALVSVHALLDKCSQHLVRFGGHPQASGFELKESSVSSFREQLAFEVKKASVDQEAHEILYDIDLSLEDVTPRLMEWLDSLGPYGSGFGPPLFALTDVEVDKVVVLRGGHRKYKLGGPGKIDALHFNADQNIEVQGRVDLLAELQWNYFAGRRQLQLVVKDFKLSTGK